MNFLYCILRNSPPGGVAPGERREDMLDFYTSISRKNDLCGVFEDAEGKRKKILFKGSAKECMEYILEKEPDNQPILRQYKLNWCR